MMQKAMINGQKLYILLGFSSGTLGIYTIKFWKVFNVGLFEIYLKSNVQIQSRLTIQETV